MKAFFNKIPEDSLPYYDAEVQIGVLVFKPKVTPELKQLALDKINGLRDRAMKGESFSTLASLYSEDPGSAENGGELGFVNRGELDPEFEAAAFALKTPGEISPVIESSFGYHIIQLIERRGERINVRHILIIPKTTTFDLAKAKVRADSVSQMINEGKISFEDAVSKFSEDENSKNNGGMLVNSSSGNTFFTISDLGQYDKSLVFVTDSMSAGNFSKPEIFKGDDGKMCYRIVYLKSETKAHRGNLKDDYDKFQSVALQNKQAEVFTKWVEDKISHNYVFVDSDYTNCDVISKWTKNQQKP